MYAMLSNKDISMIHALFLKNKKGYIKYNRLCFQRLDGRCHKYQNRRELIKDDPINRCAWYNVIDKRLGERVTFRLFSVRFRLVFHLHALDRAFSQAKLRIAHSCGTAGR